MLRCRQLRYPALMTALWLLAFQSPGRADFQVYCVSNSDGTVTCEGWQGGETLTCVGSRGGVSSCSTPSGRRFTCVMEAGGVTTCSDNRTNRPEADGTDCTFTGDGNFTCTPPTPRSAPLLPAPGIPGLNAPDRVVPALPDRDPIIQSPSVFGP